MHCTEVKVRFSELDPYGHVNHAVHLTYFETARIEALGSIGLGLARLQDEGFHLIVVEVQARYLRPAMFGDVLTVETAIAEVRAASARWSQRMTRGDELIATLELRGCGWSMSERACGPPNG
ncbi:MAG TPA: thioesterase family protein, partial [Egibacteraceae bacterium]|nr:thioesterase family protein [Egibacteraceae bacterium]